jgi:hypothetical protein
MEVPHDKEHGVIDPDKGAWAPYLWRCLHTFVEKSGRGFHGDEARELHWILTHLETVIPCALCRTHCIDYRKANPLHREGGFKAIKSSIVGYDKDSLRKWLWKFHDAVNERLGKARDVGIEDCERIYSDLDSKALWRQFFEELVGEVGRKGGLDAEKIREFNRHVILWRGFSGN